MAQALQPVASSLEKRLRAFAWRLLARQCARALPACIAGASAAVAAGMLLLVLLPKLLFDGGLLVAPTVLALAGAIGLAGGLIIGLRSLKLPSPRDAALALQSRLEHDNAALATALEARGEFADALLAGANAQLEQALRARGPQLFSTRNLLAMPALCLLAALLTALAWNTPLAGATPQRGDNAPVTTRQSGLASIDAPSVRDEADRKAMAEAMGMREVAATLQSAADKLAKGNDAAAQQSAMQQARKAVGELPADVRPAVEVPQAVPAEVAAKAKLAEDLSGAASKLRKDAEAREGGRPGTGESTGLDKAGPQREIKFVAFPKVALPAADSGTAELAGQSPARRALVQRAMEALK